MRITGAPERPDPCGTSVVMPSRSAGDGPVPSSPCVVAVDARFLAQTGKGVPRVLFETLRELATIPDIRLVLISNRPLHPDHRLPVDTIIDHTWSRLPGTIWMMARLNRLAIAAGADVLWGPAHMLPLRTARLRTVLTVHDLVYKIMPESMSPWNRFVSRLLVDGSIRRADHVITVSQTTRHDAIMLADLSGDKADVIYPGVTDPYEPCPGDGRPAPDRKNYLFALGSIEPRKNIDGFLACFAHLSAREPDLGLHITGAHSWGASKTLERIKSMPACRLLGFISDQDVRRQMLHAKAFVMPSHYEGFGLPIIEAIGLAPILAADIPVFRELARYIEGIHLIDFTNPAAAAVAIETILATDPRPARFIDGADKIFDWSNAAQAYATIFCGNPRSDRSGTSGRH